MQGHALWIWKLVALGVQFVLRVSTVVTGIVFMVVGFGLLITIVFLPGGLVLMLAGLLLVLAGLFEHPLAGTGGHT